MSQLKRKGLGRGLDVLLGNERPASVVSDVPRTLPVVALTGGKYQPRQSMNEESLKELSESIRTQGVMQPLLVRSVGNSKYEIIAGERRFRAAQIAGLAEVPVIIRDVDDQAALAMALIENLQREDLTALEEAQGIDRLIQEFGLTHDQAAQAVGRSRSATTNLIRLLQLPLAVQDMLRNQSLEAGHARALLSLPPAQARALAEKIAQERLSVRETERLVAKITAGAPVPSTSASGKVKRPSGKSPGQRDWIRVQDQLSDVLGLPVVLKPGRGSRGELVIRFASVDELDGVIDLLAPEGLPEH